MQWVTSAPRPPAFLSWTPNLRPQLRGTSNSQENLVGTVCVCGGVLVVKGWEAERDKKKSFILKHHCIVDTKTHYTPFFNYPLIQNGQGKAAFVSQDERESREKWGIHLWFRGASFTELQRPLILLPVAVILKTDLDCCATPHWLDSSYVIVNQFILERRDWIRLWPLKAIFLSKAYREFHVSRRAYTTLAVFLTTHPVHWRDVVMLNIWMDQNCTVLGVWVYTQVYG